MAQFLEPVIEGFSDNFFIIYDHDLHFVCHGHLPGARPSTANFPLMAETPYG
jgi:hypothetical protein